jgi:predicted esterase
MMIITTESDLVSDRAVPAQFRDVRRQLIEQRGKGGDSDECSWLLGSIAKQLGKDELSQSDLSKSLEHLGIDSLGRLQLWHSFKKHFPNSRLTQLSSSVPVGSLVGAPTNKSPITRSKQRWLALHGFRTNPLIMEHQVAEVMKMLLGENVDVMYAQAPHVARGPCPQGVQDGFEWWYKNGELSYETGWIGDDGLDESLKSLRDLCKREKFDGVVGFSQGGGMAHALICEEIANRAILFSPVAPMQSAWRDRKYKPDAKVVVIRDPNDTSMDGFNTEGMRCFNHTFGHTVPKPNEIANMNELKAIINQ